jgi:acyl-CoA synthetase (AMP-forming)/AMP-acid ligase II
VSGPGPLLRVRHALFDRLVYTKLRAALGGRVQYSWSAAAPLGTRLGHFFRGCGITILEGYGLTETSPATNSNTPGAQQIGTVGRPIPGATIRIAPDGEILVRGHMVFQGYWNNEPATKEMIDEDGWLHTGDIGVLDEAGFLTITGRKKDLIVTSAGKNVAPAVLEDRLRAHWLVSQCLVVGAGAPGQCHGAVLSPDRGSVRRSPLSGDEVNRDGIAGAGGQQVDQWGDPAAAGEWRPVVPAGQPTTPRQVEPGPRAQRHDGVAGRAAAAAAEHGSAAQVQRVQDRVHRHRGDQAAIRVHVAHHRGFGGDPHGQVKDAEAQHHPAQACLAERQLPGEDTGARVGVDGQRAAHRDPQGTPPHSQEAAHGEYHLGHTGYPGGAGQYSASATLMPAPAASIRTFLASSSRPDLLAACNAAMGPAV